MSGKRFLFVLVVGLLLMAGLLFYVMGESAWRLWNIPTMSPSFADMRSILAGAQAQRLGYDPLLENPLDPFGRVMAYPRIWLLLAAFKVSVANTTAFAVAETALFVLGLFIFVDRLDRPSALLIAATAISPAVMLCIERGNTDLVVFFLLALTLAVLGRLPVLSLSVAELAAFLKLYPILALGVLLRETRRTAAVWIAAALALFAAYLALIRNDIQQILAMASKGVGFNYGAGVMGLWLQDLTGSAAVGRAVVALCYLAAYVLLVLALYSSHRLGTSVGVSGVRFLDAFRMGALLYAGTFLQGNTWNYRLIFLIFTVPQLVDWSRTAPLAVRRAARLSLVFSLLSVWLPVLGASEPPALSLPGIVQVLADELLNWGLFAVLCYLLFASLPEWAGSQVKLFFEKYRRPAGARG